MGRVWKIWIAGRYRRLNFRGWIISASGGNKTNSIGGADRGTNPSIGGNNRRNAGIDAATVNETGEIQTIIRQGKNGKPKIKTTRNRGGHIPG